MHPDGNQTSIDAGVAEEKTQTTNPLTLAGNPPIVTHPGRLADLPKYDPIVGHGVWNGMG